MPTRTVLVVDDDAGVRRLVREMLTREGYDVLTAAYPTEALRLCQRHAGAIDLLLTDAVMPQMQGRELARRLTALRPAMRVLYMSGYPSHAPAAAASAAPGMVFLGKPFTAEALLGKVREALGAPSDAGA